MDTLDRIKQFIDQYEGTIIGSDVQNMLDNGENLEKICDYADIEYEEDN